MEPITTQTGDTVSTCTDPPYHVGYSLTFSNGSSDGDTIDDYATLPDAIANGTNYLASFGPIPEGAALTLTILHETTEG